MLLSAIKHGNFWIADLSARSLPVMEHVTEAVVRRRRQIQTALLIIIVLTLPCYCVGAVLLGAAPPRRNTVPTTVLTPTLSGGFGSITPSTLVPSVTSVQFTQPTSLPPLGPTPT